MSIILLYLCICDIKSTVQKSIYRFLVCEHHLHCSRSGLNCHLEVVVKPLAVFVQSPWIVPSGETSKYISSGVPGFDGLHQVAPGAPVIVWAPTSLTRSTKNTEVANISNFVSLFFEHLYFFIFHPL